MRIIHASKGEEEYLVGLVREKQGLTLISASFQIGFGTPETPPETWLVPSIVDIQGAKANISYKVISTTPLVERKVFWIKVTDRGEIYYTSCDNELISIR